LGNGERQSRLQPQVSSLQPHQRQRHLTRSRKGAKDGMDLGRRQTARWGDWATATTALGARHASLALGRRYYGPLHLRCEFSKLSPEFSRFHPSGQYRRRASQSRQQAGRDAHLPNLALPYCVNAEPHCSKSPSVAPVSSLVTGDLLLPVLLARFRAVPPFRTPAVTVPKTPVHEDGESFPREVEVGRAGQMLGVAAEAESQTAQEGGKLLLGSRVLTFHGLHNLSPFGFCKDVDHTVYSRQPRESRSSRMSLASEGGGKPP